MKCKEKERIAEQCMTKMKPTLFLGSRNLIIQLYPSLQDPKQSLHDCKKNRRRHIRRRVLTKICVPENGLLFAQSLYALFYAGAEPGNPISCTMEAWPILPPHFIQSIYKSAVNKISEFTEE